jgi:hypothetical protein
MAGTNTSTLSLGERSFPVRYGNKDVNPDAVRLILDRRAYVAAIGSMRSKDAGSIDNFHPDCLMCSAPRS